MDAKSLYEMVKGSPEVWGKDVLWDGAGLQWDPENGGFWLLPDREDIWFRARPSSVELVLEALYARATGCSVEAVSMARPDLFEAHRSGCLEDPDGTTYPHGTSRLAALVAAHNAQKGQDHAR